MAGANEFPFFFNPRNGTSEVSADCRQNNHFALGAFANVNRFLCNRPAPTIPLLNCDQLLHGSIEVLKFINVSHVGPRLFRRPSQYRMQTETDQWNGEDRSDRRASCSEKAGQK